MPEQMRLKTNVSKPHKISPVSRPERKRYSHPLLKMQESVGNKALIKLKDSLGVLQTKLSLGKPHDMYEQEADTVASRVVKQLSQVNKTSVESASEANQPVHMVQRQEEEELAMQRPTESIQRQEDEEYAMLRETEPIQRQVEGEEEEEEAIQLRRSEQIQRQEDEELAMLRGSEVDQSTRLDHGPVTDEVENQVQRARQGGEVMDTSTQAQMENGFGYDFGQVHIHNDAQSDQIARQLNSEAFTVKGDIFFRNGRYNPTSTQGQDLLAHELTHVVQQGSAPSRNSGTSPESPI